MKKDKKTKISSITGPLIAHASRRGGENAPSHEPVPGLLSRRRALVAASSTCRSSKDSLSLFLSGLPTTSLVGVIDPIFYLQICQREGGKSALLISGYCFFKMHILQCSRVADHYMKNPALFAELKLLGGTPPGKGVSDKTDPIGLDSPQ
jgi:hypothetical protein